MRLVLFGFFFGGGGRVSLVMDGVQNFRLVGFTVCRPRWIYVDTVSRYIGHVHYTMPCSYCTSKRIFRKNTIIDDPYFDPALGGWVMGDGMWLIFLGLSRLRHWG